MMTSSTTDPIDWLEAFAALDADRIWLRDAHGTETFGGLLGAVRNMAGRLGALGVKPGDRVAAQVEKSRQALHLYLACLWSGAVYMPLNNGYTESEIDYFLGDAKPSLFVVAPDSGHLSRSDVHLATLDSVGGGSLMVVAAEPVRARERWGGETLAAMLYTSGTTGKPKGAMLSRGNLAASAVTLVEAWRFMQDDVLIHALPIFHVHGLFVATNTVLASGASMTLLPKFDADEVIGLFDKASVLMGVPTFYTRLLGSPRLTRDSVSQMRLFVSGSAPLLAETHREFEVRTGHVILERYGMTETMMNTSNPYDGKRVPGTVGPPLPRVSVRVVDTESGTEMPVGQIGSIEVKGPNVFQGYWKNPEKTAAEFRPDGFFITGDLGKLDEAGYVHIIGRGKDLIISGGLNIYPKEVEDVLDLLPGVVESAVIGVPHPDFGEAVVALVVGEEGLSSRHLLDALTDRLARFKHPKRILFVPELPRNTMGKVQKAKLRALHQNAFS